MKISNIVACRIIVNKATHCVESCIDVKSIQTIGLERFAYLSRKIHRKITQTVSKIVP